MLGSGDIGLSDIGPIDDVVDIGNGLSGNVDATVSDDESGNDEPLKRKT